MESSSSKRRDVRYFTEQTIKITNHRMEQSFERGEERQ